MIFKIYIYLQNIAVEQMRREDVTGLGFSTILKFIVRYEMMKRIKNVEDKDKLILMEEKIRKKIELMELELNFWMKCRKQVQWLMNPSLRESTIGEFINETASQYEKGNEEFMGDVFGELFDEFFPAKVFGHTLQGMYIGKAKESNNATETDDSEEASP